MKGFFGVMAAAMLAVIGLLALIDHVEGKQAEQQHQREIEWLKFSERNHCTVEREASFSNSSTLWKCDGFSVVTHP